MKKILYVALAARMLISCDPNAPKIPSKDNKMLDQLAQNYLSLLGEKKKTAISTLEDLGFVKTDDLGLLPARHNKQAQKAEWTSITFFYGNVEAYEEAMEDEDWDAWIDHLTEKKELYAYLELQIDANNKVASIMIDYYAPADIKNIKGTYTKFSKTLFLSLDEGKEWIGYLGDLEDYLDAEYNDEVLKNYSIKKRDKFEEDLADEDITYIRELGEDEYEDEGAYRVYHGLYYSDYGLVSPDYDGLANGYFTASLVYE